MRYIVVSRKSWNRQIFEDKISKYPGEWVFIESPENLNVDKVRSISPRYIFFLHWSWKVRSEIVKNYECVCFHMTDLPYGRGGSPLQNLIVRGCRKTKLTALKMTEELDAGPIYMKEDLSLEGLAEEIYIRASNLAADMILRIIRKDIEPTPQTGRTTVFKRRKPEESEVPQAESLLKLFDFIRMLDAEKYPKAFFIYKGFRYEFSRPAFYRDHINADIKITLPSKESSK